MSKKKPSEAKRKQRERKCKREAYLSPEMKASFKAINIWIDRQRQSDEVKKQMGCAKSRANRRKLIRLSESQNHRCCYCGGDTWHPEIIDYQTHRSKLNKATLEHLMLDSKGGTYRWDNLVMACSECNTARGDLPIEEFLASIQTTYKPNIPRSIIERKKDVAREEKKQLKEHKSARNRFVLFMIASQMSPDDYQYVMENITKQDARHIFKGGKKPTKPRKNLMKRIRSRVKQNQLAS